MVPDDDSLLIYAPVALHRGADGAFRLEDQACNGLRLWAANFARVIALMPESPAPPPPSWVPLARVGEALARIEVIPLPEAWRPLPFLRALPGARRTIRAAIGRARFLSFAIGGLFGDWGAVACAEAHRMGRPHAVWTDRVESAVTRALAADPAVRWRTRLRARLTAGPMAALERRTIRRATVGLFHGAETFAAYAPFARAAEVVHDVHIARADHIAPDALAAKQAAAAAADGPLEIVYAGRAEAMKGATDWVEVLIRLAAAGVAFRARWLGTGSLLPAMRARLAAAGLAERVTLPGHTADRGAVFAALRAAHLLLFCHRTPESPRVLIEALVSGTPILGYDGAFAREITARHGGGVLVPLGDVAGLAAAVAALAADRARLADLIGRAAADGAPFEDAAVFRHRSDLIRRHLGG
jgi:glycosyltransferase involved in cell wall biosynthesis